MQGSCDEALPKFWLCQKLGSDPWQDSFLVDLTKCSTYLKDDRDPLRFFQKDDHASSICFLLPNCVEQQFAKYIVSKVGRITAVMLVSGKSSQVVWVIRMVKLVWRFCSRIPGSTVAALAGSKTN